MTSVFEINGKKYYVGSEIARELKYKRPNDAIRAHVKNHNKISVEDLKKLHNAFECKLLLNTNLIDEDGMKDLIIGSRIPYAIDYAKKYGINVSNHKIACKEATTLSCIMKAFATEKFEFQRIVGRYRIDLYFPEHKLAIECDENGHQDRDKYEEVKRQKYLEETLKCKFIRYNPDAKDFDIFNVIHEIMKHIYMKK
jgi:very-short-patch-repair endonuclease